jgi:hypothetical protein
MKIKSSRRSFLLAAGTSLFATAVDAAFAQTTSTEKANTLATTEVNASSDSSLQRVAIVWKEDVEGGEVELTHASLESLDGKMAKLPGDFRLVPGTRRLQIQLDEVHTELGAMATCVTMRYRIRNVAARDVPDGFTFFLRDVVPETPLLVRGLKVAVVPASDSRTYDQIEAAVLGKGLRSKPDQIEAEPEETYENACRHTRSNRCPTWLGIGRDIRIFRVMPSDADGYWGIIEPYDFGLPATLGSDKAKKPLRYSFTLGRGAACEVNLRRRLEDGVLPIVQSVQREGEIEYCLTMFATLEKEPLSVDTVRGTHWTAALANTLGPMLTKQETALYKNELQAAEVFHREQELICWVHVEMVNRGPVPQYAYLKAGQLVDEINSATKGQKFLDGKCVTTEGSVAGIHRLNGQPMPQEEMAVLLQPGGRMNWEMLVPHRPLPLERAKTLAGQPFEAHYQACQFWRQKLENGTRISLPEPGVDERIRAGLLHLDIATTGLAKAGPLLANVGWFSPIGSESAPIIQFYDSLGYHDLAGRSIQFFLDRQRKDGFIETFGGYQLETGPVLWTIGEHFRYTRNVAWARRIQPKVMKACEYLLAWRRRNMKEELRGKGYGLIDGKVADPNDFFHSFMLNGLAYVGLKRVVEMYAKIDPDAFADVKQELGPYLADIRRAYSENAVRSPLIPLHDGTWVSSFSPWAEYRGPVSLFAEGGSWFSHSMFASRDSLIGALYLGIGEVLDPKEPLAAWLLHAHQELMTHRNAGFSQPYYCRHDWLHLRRGEVKQYLKTYYNQFSAIQDRETYSFWEIYSGGSQHKTHEEGWFLMQTRWMLWDEDYEASVLRLLSMIPRAWMNAGKDIRLEKCQSYFGPFSLKVRPRLAADQIEAAIELYGPTENWPKTIVLRLPHPAGRHPQQVQGGRYDAKTESLVLEPNAASMRMILRYA